MAENIVWIVLGMGVVTAIPRVLPVFALGGRPLPTPVQDWLRWVPLLVIAACLGPELFLKSGSIDLSLKTNPALYVAIPTFLIGVWQRNFLLTVVFALTLLSVWRSFI